MSNNNPIDLRQDRREWVKHRPAIVGPSLPPSPAITQEQPHAETASAKPVGKSSENNFPSRFFTPLQHELVEELSETIIPADDHSGGAKAAKVADFIDQLLGETYDENQKALWREGLRLVDLMSRHYSGKSLLEARPEERVAGVKMVFVDDNNNALAQDRFFFLFYGLSGR